RAPDYSGLQYWLSEMEHGKTMTDIARAFAGHSRFLSDYASLSNQQFVEVMYKEGLGNQGDSTGIAYWTGKINQGQSRPDMLAEFALATITADLVSAKKSQALSDADYWAASVRQNALLNRVDLGLEFAMKFGSASDPREASDLDVAYHAAKLLLTKVDASDDSLEAALLSLQTANSVSQVAALMHSSPQVELVGMHLVTDYL
ncbi:DUF4214 domain-containing protein, partial [Undibacterium fentianense]